MLNRLCAAFCLFPALLCHADPPPGYYAGAEGRTGRELRDALHAIIRGHIVIPYSSSSFDTIDAVKLLEEDPADDDNVWLLYAQRSEPKDDHGDVWNREHLWPRPYGLGTNGTAFTDLHNLRAEDQTVNTARDKKLYDVSDTNDVNYAFPAHLEAPLCSTDTDSWQPPVHVRGDIARTLFYMDVRYSGDVSGERDLILTDVLEELATTTNLMGRLSTLLRWHVEDPVDAPERGRNELVFRYQRNRNPFIDRPEWVMPVFAPVVSIRRDTSAGQYRISWPAIYKDAIVETSPSLLPPDAAWSRVGLGLADTNHEFYVIEPTRDTPNNFYRLLLR